MTFYLNKKTYRKYSFNYEKINEKFPLRNIKLLKSMKLFIIKAK